MIKNDTVTIIINNRLVPYYKKIGYNIKGGDTITIPTIHLPKNSKVRIIAICCNCHSENDVDYQKYNQNIERGGKYYCKKCNNITYKVSMLKLYNVDNSLKSSLIKNKIKTTVKERYGVDWITSNRDVIEKTYNTRLKNGTIQKYNMEEYKFYMIKVINLTSKYKKQIYNNWNGYDYYDNEYIAENLQLNHNHRDYPVIDHIISKNFGFIHNIDVEIISHPNNLCITKNHLNIKKSNKSEIEFRNYLNSISDIN